MRGLKEVYNRGCLILSVWGLSSFPFLLLSQPNNLIPNPGFESYTKCPEAQNFHTEDNEEDQPDKVNYAPPWETYYASPDFYTKCAGWGANAPENFRGHQHPYSGQSYGGFLVYSSDPDHQHCEILITPLKDTLRRGHKYKLTVHLSLSDIGKYALPHLGLHFSNKKYSVRNLKFNKGAVTNHEAQVKLQQPGGLTDQEGWMTVQDSFVAEGGEKYLYVGSFLKPAYIISSDGYRELGYYYFDNIQLQNLGKSDRYQPKVFVPNAFSPNADGVNDRLKPVSDVELQNYTFKVFNRWGENLFTTHQQQKGWNGKHNGKRSSEGVYVWTLSYTDVLNQTYQKSGYITLTR